MRLLPLPLLALLLLPACRASLSDPDASPDRWAAGERLHPGDGPRGDGPRGDGPVSACGNGACEAAEETTCPADCPPGIWRPRPGTSWQWQLSGSLDTSLQVAMYDIDLFTTSAATIAGLKAKGRKVICYFSAGSYEDGRPDSGDFPAAVRGEKMVGWDEDWLDVRAPAVRTIMQKRLDLARSKGCDGVEPDNVDGYANDSGFPLSAADQLAFNIFLSKEAHARGLSVGLKNDLDQIPQLLPYFDWALNEECVEFDECATLKPFIAAGKAVFHVEYKPGASAGSVCPQVKPLGFDTLIKNLELDAWREAC